MVTAKARRRLYVAAFCFHFVLILLVCLRDTSALIARGNTCVPEKAAQVFGRAQIAFHAALGELLPRLNPFRLAVATYLHCAGTSTGYGFFAPNVPDNHKLVFELEYPDGHVEYELPPATSRGGGLRMATLLDNLGQTRYDALRELIIKTIAFSIWRQHPEVKRIRAVFGFSMLPTPQQFKAGIKETYQFLYAYDFSFSEAGERH